MEMNFSFDEVEIVEANVRIKIMEMMDFLIGKVENVEPRI